MHSAETFDGAVHGALPVAEALLEHCQRRRSPQGAQRFDAVRVGDDDVDVNAYGKKP